MSDLTQRYQGRVKVLHINVDAPEAGPLLKKYNVRGTPTIVLLDRHGQVAGNVPGFPGEQTLATALDQLAAQP